MERRGKPTITISHDKFERASYIHARSLGMPDLAFLIEPAPRSGNVSVQVKSLARDNIELVIKALTSGRMVQ